MSRTFWLCVVIVFACGAVAADEYIKVTVEEAGENAGSLGLIGITPNIRGSI